MPNQTHPSSIQIQPGPYRPTSRRGVPCCFPVVPQVTLGFPDLPLVPEPVLYDQTGLLFDPCLLEGPFWRLVLFVVLPWVTHLFHHLLFLPLHTHSGAGTPGGLASAVRGPLAGFMPDSTVAADFPQQIDILVECGRQVGAKNVPAFSSIHILGPVDHPRRDSLCIVLHHRLKAVYILILETSHYVVSVDTGKPGYHTCGVSANALDARKGNLDLFRPIQIRVTDPLQNILCPLPEPSNPSELSMLLTLREGFEPSSPRGTQV